VLVVKKVRVGIFSFYKIISFCGVVYVFWFFIVTRYLPAGILDMSMLYVSFLLILAILSL
jgi:hypothetical protein